jgi:hypothetical protein
MAGDKERSPNIEDKAPPSASTGVVEGTEQSHRLRAEAGIFKIEGQPAKFTISENMPSAGAATGEVSVSGAGGEFVEGHFADEGAFGTSNEPVITEDDDTVEATGVLGPVQASGIGTVHNLSVSETLSTSDSVDADVTHGIWNASGSEIHFAIDKAEQELELARQILLFATSVHGNNNPPSLLGTFEDDISNIEQALLCLKVLRKVIDQPQPDADLLRLLWQLVVSALRTVGRVIGWIGYCGKSIYKKFDESTFGKAFLKSAGTVAGATAMTAIISFAANGAPGLEKIGALSRAALATIGISL